MLWRDDCRFFLGEKPCRFKRLCQDCDKYRPQGQRILIIKLGAMGDVLRTTPLLPALKARYPQSFITWITYSNAYPLLADNPLIDRLWPLDLTTLIGLQTETFDQVICLDKSMDATGLAMLAKAENKMGFGMKENGALTFLNNEAEYAFRLGLDDELKFKANQKSYQEITFEMLGLSFTGQEYMLNISSSLSKQAKKKLFNSGARENQRLVGLNTGCGPVFATKKWTEPGFIELGEKLIGTPDIQAVLMGGPDEIERNSRIKEAAPGLIDSGTDNSLSEFAALIGQLDLLITGYTIALHLAIAQKIPVLAIFGPTSHTEIDLYGRGKKLITDFPCAPCYLKICDQPQNCMEALTAEEVYQAALGILKGGQS